MESCSSTVPWREMFQSASFRMPKSDPFSDTETTDHVLSPKDHALQTQGLSAIYVPEAAGKSSCSSEIRGLRSYSLDHNPSSSLNLNSENSSSVPWQVMFRTASFSRPDLSSRNQNPIAEDSAAATEKAGHDILVDSKLVEVSTDERNVTGSTSETSERIIEKIEAKQKSCFASDAWIWVAVYVTLGQAAVTVLISLSYGVSKLLEEYIRPIIWASLCSIPLRGIQDTLVEFWSEPLEAGLTDAILAVPVAILRAFAGTLIDARDVFSWVFYGENKLKDVRPEKNGFIRLVRRLVSFSLFVFAYEQIGRFGAFTLIGLGFMLSSNLSTSTISAVSSLRSDSFRQRSNTCTQQNKVNNPNLDKISRVVSQGILSRLKTILAVGLIIGMIIGSLAGLMFFTYQIGAEGKDAVISIKFQIEESNYAENIFIKKWIQENHAMELMDWYTSECYETLLHQIDKFAYKYNLSEFIEVIKHFAITPYSDDFPENSSIFFGPPQARKYTFKLRNLMEKPVLNKAKCLATQGMDLWFWVLTNSKFLLDGSAHFLLYIGHVMVSGAAGIMQFLLQSVVFFWVLYYLLTSDSSGVTEQVMKVLPLQKHVKDRCVEALNNAISGVLLATAEIAFFQGCFTWLLYRLFSVHFVYMSTMLAFINPLLPIFPAWLPTLPGAVELVLDGRYFLAISFCITHILVLDFGAFEIAESVPGYSTYLTGVSIIGGMTLFPSALEGAIMGPLITTVVIALKDLYAEFVLNETMETKEKSSE
ncbi:uncharacterized protein LOC110707039 isoform X1 [Chenopodium quinoa]|uniref:uncharacterized protein LOC110707039 isoform X1 n=1 Tax=Chenopodium quinoa TaxID=63459 RepID=UPI000B79980E|nr:uncharacterized protein LOC110707039 isoform X1 [Chenopodium quinoa]